MGRRSVRRKQLDRWRARTNISMRFGRSRKETRKGREIDRDGTDNDEPGDLVKKIK